MTGPQKLGTRERIRQTKSLPFETHKLVQQMEKKCKQINLNYK